MRDITEGDMFRGRLCFIAVLTVCSFAPGAAAQEIQVNRSNRTISLTVTESLQVDAEVAELQIGYHNFGRTHEAAYEENVRAADKVVDALLKANIPKENVQTEALTLHRVEEDELKHLAPEARKERQFEARQSWTVRISVPDAQKVVDLAVGAGANEVQDVSWTVSDPKTLEAKANAAALAKARTLAEQMARQFSAKLGELLYASNRAPSPLRGLVLETAQASVVTRSAVAPPKPVLKLFPKKVEREATIYAVFALD